MTGPGFSAETGRLLARAADFGGFAARAARIAADLDWALDATGEAWGTDTPGQSFAAIHTAPAADTRTIVRGLSGRLADWETRLTEAAKAYRGGDIAAAEQVERQVNG